MGLLGSAAVWFPLGVYYSQTEAGTGIIGRLNWVGCSRWLLYSLAWPLTRVTEKTGTWLGSSLHVTSLGILTAQFQDSWTSYVQWLSSELLYPETHTTTASLPSTCCGRQAAPFFTACAYPKWVTDQCQFKRRGLLRDMDVAGLSGGHHWGPVATSLTWNLNQWRQEKLRYLKYLWEQHRAKVNI